MNRKQSENLTCTTDGLVVIGNQHMRIPGHKVLRKIGNGAIAAT
jgi:hypothetical protein